MTKSLSRKFPKKNPVKKGPVTPAQSLASRIAGLEQGQKVLIETSNTNAEAFRDCLYALEANQWIIMKAVDDIAAGTVKKTSSGTVNWESYQEDYKKFVEKQEEKKQVSEAFATEDIVFGGGG